MGLEEPCRLSILLTPLDPLNCHGSNTKSSLLQYENELCPNTKTRGTIVSTIRMLRHSFPIEAFQTITKILLRDATWQAERETGNDEL